MIHHIILDMGNVLLAFDPHQAVRDVLGEIPELEAVVHATTLTSEWKALDKGTISEQDAIDAMCSKAPALAELIRQFMAHWDEHLLAVPGMLELVEELKNKGYSLHLLSNAGLRFDRYHPRYPVFQLLDTIDISAKLKALKPQPEIYRLMLQKRGLNAQDCLFIDDLQENVDGARSVGIPAIRFVDEPALRADCKRLGIL